ncbi:hypothetical protein JCM18899A_37050 [Nocardioides sp. AN3]
MTAIKTPDGIPVLSRGKHRNPRRGACFMEMASVLAGEPWSDHPKCTHPLVAHLARMVNDYTSDDGRARLAPHIPSVVGIRGGGLPWEVELTAAVAVEVVPQVPARFQRMLAVGLLRCEEMALRLGPDGVVGLGDMRQAMSDVPHATAWARRFVNDMPLTAKQFQERSAPHLITCAVRGIAETAAPDIDERLYHLLTTVLDVARRPQSPTQAALAAEAAEAAETAETASRPGDRRFAETLWW